MTHHSLLSLQDTWRSLLFLLPLPLSLFPPAVLRVHYDPANLEVGLRRSVSASDVQAFPLASASRVVEYTYAVEHTLVARLRVSLSWVINWGVLVGACFWALALLAPSQQEKLEANGVSEGEFRATVIST